MDNERTNRILKAIAPYSYSSAATVSEIANKAKTGLSTAYASLKLLREVGLVQSKKEGGKILYYSSNK